MLKNSLRLAAVVDAMNMQAYKGRQSDGSGRIDQILAIRGCRGHLAQAADACQSCDLLYAYETPP